jgi:hypothetical protein
MSPTALLNLMSSLALLLIISLLIVRRRKPRATASWLKPTFTVVAAAMFVLLIWVLSTR